MSSFLLASIVPGPSCRSIDAFAKRLRAVPWLLVLVALIDCFSVKTARAYTPEDPEVQEMVNRGLRYLEGLTETQLKSTQWGGADGQVVLAGYAHFKVEHNPDAPLVQLAIKHAMVFVADIRKNNGKMTHGTKTPYEVAVSILLLAEIDTNAYSEELRLLGKGLFDVQQSHGGYGYPGEPLGDVSQVQYVVLAMWTLDRAGFDLPLPRVQATLSWLMRVQDVSGSWPYKGEDPGKGRPLIVQPKHEMSVSTSLAGGSSVLICSDVFRIWGTKTSTGSGIEGLPKALKPIEKGSAIDARRKMSPVKPDDVLTASRRMDAYRTANPVRRTATADWYYYMLYTLERYESFMELAMGKPTQPGWYDEGVTSLMSLQDASGAWGVKDKSWNDPPVCTSFAILFLIRSTKRAIAAVSKGSLAGGYGLPTDTTKIVVNGSQIKAEPTETSVNDLLSLLETDQKDDSVNDSGIAENIKLEQDPERRRQQLARFERVIRGSQSWTARQIAARVLGTSDDLAVVPSLIYAISDPDKKTRVYALSSLQFISRKFDQGVVPDAKDISQVRAAQQVWIEWYQSIRPNYVFIDGTQ